MFGSNSGSGGFSFGGSSNNANSGANTGGGFGFGSNNNTAASTGTTSGTGFTFGGASSNTASSNTGNLFGAKPATSATPSFGAAFGASSAPKSNNFTFGSSSTSNPAPATGGGFGFGTSASTPAAGGASSGGFFGSAKPASSTVQGGTGTSLFGGNSGPTSTAPTTGGFGFGTSNNNTASNGTSGGLFGAKPTASTSTSLFGNTGNNASSSTGGTFAGSSQPGTSSGLFGNNSNQASTAQSGGLFGGNNQNTGTGVLSGSGGLFGSKPAAPTLGGGTFGNNFTNTASSGGLFGRNNNNTATSTGMFGGVQSQPPQQLMPQLNAMTKVGELPEAFQKELEELDQYIQTQVSIAENLKTNDEEHRELVDSIPRDINFLEKKYISTNQALNSDLKFVESFKSKTIESFNDWVEKLIKVYLQLTNPMLLNSVNGSGSASGDLSQSSAATVRIIGVSGMRSANYHQPQQQGQAQQKLQVDNETTNLNVAQILNSYFVTKVEEFKENIEKYQIILQEVENSVNDLDKVSMNGGLTSNTGNYGLEMIVSTLQEEFKLYVELANEFAEIHHEVKNLSGGNEMF